MQLMKGDRVITPLGVGTVVYIRMDAPDYSKVVAVSVLLDSKKDIKLYCGTIFHSSDVRIV